MMNHASALEHGAPLGKESPDKTWWWEGTEGKNGEELLTLMWDLKCWFTQYVRVSHWLCVPVAQKVELSKVGVGTLHAPPSYSPVFALTYRISICSYVKWESCIITLIWLTGKLLHGDFKTWNFHFFQFHLMPCISI